MFLFEVFSEVDDPRTPCHSLRHRLADILCIALCAVVSGAESFVDMADYGVAKERWLRERLGLELPHGIPCHDTFQRVFSRLNPTAFEECFMRWTQQLHQQSGGDLLAIDGKAVRHSFDTASGQGALHLVSVWASEARLVLAQQKVEAKSNEMTAVPLLLEMLDLQGSVVTTDALNTQKNIAAAIQEGGGDYVLALKENHRHLFEDVRDYFAWCQKQKQKANAEPVWDATWEKSEWGHGRHEVRRGYVLTTTPEEWPEALRAWTGLQSVVMVERERTVLPPEGIPAEGMPVGAVLSPTRSRHFFLSSLEATDGRIEKAIRAHWGIENSLHWVLDVAFDEDGCRIRKDHAPQNFATLRKIALNLLRQDQKVKCGVKGRRKMAGWDDDYLLRILAAP
jgi:predicted transposase YbfD/YdcC